MSKPIIFQQGTSSSLENLPLRDGQIIFTTDEKHLYLDVQLEDSIQRLKISANADTAITAIYDNLHDNISTIAETYFESVSIDGTKITLTKGDGSTSIIDTKDTVVVYKIKTDDGAYPIAFTPAGQSENSTVEDIYINEDITITPSTKTINANLNGTASIATLAKNAENADLATKATVAEYDSQHDTPIYKKYFSNATINGQTITLSRPDGENIVLKTVNTDTKVTNEKNNTTKAFVTGATEEGTGTQIFDENIYLDTTEGQLVATSFKGKLVGNADSSTKTTYDSTGTQKITETYIKNATIKDNVITFIRGDGSTAATVTVVNTDKKVTNTLNKTTKAYITGTTNSSTNTGEQVFDTGVYLGAEAGQLVATKFTGKLDGNAETATKATQDINGNAIIETYISNIEADTSSDGIKITWGNGSSKVIHDKEVLNEEIGADIIAYLTATTQSEDGTSTQVFNKNIYLDSEGTLSAAKFKGPLEGNVVGDVTGNLTGTADKATVAIKDSQNNNFIDTYYSSVEADGTKLTFKTPSGSISKTINTQDNKVAQNLISNPNTADTYPILLGPKGANATSTGESYFDSGITVNPNTNVINADISGNALSADTAETADKAINDVNGKNIRTYAAGLQQDTTDKHILKLVDADGAVLSTITTVDNNADTKVKQTLVSDNTAYPLLLTPAGQTATATAEAKFDSGVTLNPSTNIITANISGNAATATKADEATKATYDSTGTQKIQDTYLANVTFNSSTRVLNLINGAGGSNGTITLPSDNDTKVTQILVSDNKEYPILLTPTGQTATTTTTANFDSGITVNPSTNAITATSFNGKATSAGTADTATKATKDSEGNTIYSTYINSITQNGESGFKWTKPDGTNGTISAANDKVTQKLIASTNASNYPVLLAPTGQTAEQRATSNFATNLQYKPSTNTLTTNISGNADTATEATYAAIAGNATTHDSASIRETYFSGVSVSGKTITFTTPSGATKTITTQDTNTDTKVTQNLVAETVESSYPVLLAPTGQTAKATTTANFTTGLQYTPSTNILAANISGNAATATTANHATTADKAKGDDASIRETYFSGVSINGKTITFTTPSGATETITTQDTNTDTKVTQTLVGESTNSNYPVLLAPTGQTATKTTTSNFTTGLQYNPSTNTLTANVPTADLASKTNYANGDTDKTIREKYASNLTVGDDNKINLISGSGATVATIEDKLVYNAPSTTDTKIYLTGTKTATAGSHTQLFDTDVYLNASDGSITAKKVNATTFDGTTFTGNAETATKATNSDYATYATGDTETIRNRYASSLELSDYALTLKNGAGGTLSTITIPDKKVTNTLNKTAKAYITGTTNATTNTGTQIFDTGVYLGTTAGHLHATQFNGKLVGNVTGNVTGDLTGNADSADKATYDGSGTKLITSYISNVSLNGSTLKQTTGAGTTTDIGNFAILGSDGKISMDNLPEGAIPKMVVVGTHDEMLLLTKDDVQNGDVVLVEDDVADNTLHYVYDETKLSQDGTTAGSMDAFKAFISNIAALAYGDGDGDIITTTYGASLNLSGYTLTLKDKQGGTLSTITIPDKRVTQTVTTSNANYPLLLAASGQTSTKTQGAYFDSGVTLNPSTNTIAANISGNAATATKATNADNATEATHADSADSATKATYDSTGTKLITSYVASLKGGTRSVTPVLGDGTSGTAVSVVDPTVAQTADTTTSGTAVYPLLFSNQTKPTSGTAYGTKYDTAITVNPATNTITATTFSGNATTATKATSADSATKATYDSTGTQIITETYIKALSGGTRTVGYTKGDGTTGSVSVIDPRVTQTSTTSTGALPILMAYQASGGTSNVLYNSGVTITPSTATITATNFTGLASKATADSNGDNIRASYASSLVWDSTTTSDTTLVLKSKSGAKLVDMVDLGTRLLELTGGTMSGDITFSAGSNQASTGGINWGKIGTATPFVGYADDQSDGTFLLMSLAGSSSYKNGLAIGGSSGNLLWKGNVVLDQSTTRAANLSVKHADSSDSATKATQDSAGNQINTTYVASLTGGTRTVTYKKGDGTSSSITVTDPRVTQSADTGSTALPILLAYQASGGTGQAKFDADVTITPSTSTVTAATFAGNLTGLASKATADSNGDNFRSTYFSEVSVSGKTITFKTPDGTTASITTQDTNTDTKVTQTLVSDDKEYPLLLAPTGQTATTTTTSKFDSGVTLNPSTNTISATKFKGALTGNADSATKASYDSSGTKLITSYVSSIGWNSTTTSDTTVKLVSGAGDSVSTLDLGARLLELTGGTVTGTLVLSKTTDLSGTANNSPALIVGGTATSTHMEIDANKIQGKTNGTSVAPIYINNDGGLVTIGSGGLTNKGALNVTGETNLSSKLTVSGATLIKNTFEATGKTTIGGVLTANDEVIAAGLVTAKAGVKIGTGVTLTYNVTDECLEFTFS